MNLTTDPALDPSNADYQTLSSALASLYAVAPTMASWEGTATLQDDGSIDCQFAILDTNGEPMGFRPLSPAGRAQGVCKTALELLCTNDGVSEADATFP